MNNGLEEMSTLLLLLTAFFWMSFGCYLYLFLRGNGQELLDMKHIKRIYEFKGCKLFGSIYFEGWGVGAVGFYGFFMGFFINFLVIYGALWVWYSKLLFWNLNVEVVVRFLVFRGSLIVYVLWTFIGIFSSLCYAYDWTFG